MAKLKYEFSSHYYKSHPHQARDYIFGYIGLLTKLGAPFGKLINWGMGNQVIGNWAKRFLNISEMRKLPLFQKLDPDSLLINHTSLGETVLFLPDAFTRYFEPEIERAALRVLRAAGCRVVILPILGAGRTLISKGFLEAAKKHAQEVRNAIDKIDPEGNYPVVGVEPSEIYTLKDEYLDFFPNNEDMRSLNQRSFLIDELLMRDDRVLRVANKIKVDRDQDLQKVSLHGHCYQKARPPADDGLPVGQEATAALLRAFGYEVEIIPSGCCGMAGSFGYEEEHYALSMQVGELVLFPEIRRKMGADGTTSIVAPGTSCREQIADGTGVAADHPLVLISAISDGS
ncbi:MAG: hypothetical protein HQ525_12785 [Anaerolineae bacterium]|nr:hypothetical protein [Anaerolineae bacterium]